MLLFALNWLSQSHQRALRYTAATWSVPSTDPVLPVSFSIELHCTAVLEQASPDLLRNAQVPPKFTVTLGGPTE